MKKLLLIITIFISVQAFGQQATPAQLIRLARATYEQGRLHDIPHQLEAVLNDTRTTNEEKIEAYKILCLTYIYLEEPAKADEAMLNILKIDHFFEVNRSIDPAEFVALYRTFRTHPLFSVGLKVGPNATFPRINTNYSVGGSAFGKGEYKSKINVQIGVVFEKHLKGKFSIAPELLYSGRSFSYNHPAIFVSDETQNSVASQTVELSQNWIDLNMLIQYQLKKSALNPYVSLGPGVSALLNAEATAETTYESGQVTSGPPIDLKPSYKSLGFSAIGTAGVKYKFGAIYLTGEVRYQFGFTRVVNEKKRTDFEATFNYVINPNIYSQHSAAVLVGFVYPIFSPKKLIH